MTDTEKERLRARVVAARRAIPEADRAARSREVALRVAALPAFARARVVALYAPMGAELDTAELGRLALAAGKELAWPRLVEGTRRLAFAACHPSALLPGPFSTRQPPPDAPAVPFERIDLVCVPGVAFDASLRRLGRGGGYYDATLPAFGGWTLRVGLAFEAQVVAAVPAEPGDAPVDVLATESRLLGLAGLPAAG